MLLSNIAMRIASCAKLAGRPYFRTGRKIQYQ